MKKFIIYNTKFIKFYFSIADISEERRHRQNRYYYTDTDTVCVVVVSFIKLYPCMGLVVVVSFMKLYPCIGLLFLLYSQSTHKKVKNLSLKLSIHVLKVIEYGCC